MKDRKSILGKIKFLFTYIVISKKFVNMFEYLYVSEFSSKETIEMYESKLDRIVLWYIGYYTKYSDTGLSIDLTMLKIFDLHGIVKLHDKQKEHFVL